MQSGIDRFGSEEVNSNSKTAGYLTNTVIRYGIREQLEASASLELKTETLTGGTTEVVHHGLSAFDVGLRYHILTARGWLPNVGFQARVRLPILSKDYEIKDLAPRFILVLSRQLPWHFFLLTNWGAAWNGNDNSPTGTYVINLSYPFNDKLGSFVEVYGGVKQGRFTVDMDTGIAWLLTNDVQLDLYGGYGNNYGILSHFVSVGVSVRTRRKTK